MAEGIRLYDNINVSDMRQFDIIIRAAGLVCFPELADFVHRCMGDFDLKKGK